MWLLTLLASSAAQSWCCQGSVCAAGRRELAGTQQPFQPVWPVSQAWPSADSLSAAASLPRLLLRACSLPWLQARAAGRCGASSCSCCPALGRLCCARACLLLARLRAVDLAGVSACRTAVEAAKVLSQAAFPYPAPTAPLHCSACLLSLALCCRAWAKGVGFSSGGGRQRNGEGPQIWDASQAAAVQRVEDEQRGAVLRSLAATLAEAQESGKFCMLSAAVCVQQAGAMKTPQLDAAQQRGAMLRDLAAMLQRRRSLASWLAMNQQRQQQQHAGSSCRWGTISQFPWHRPTSHSSAFDSLDSPWTLRTVLQPAACTPCSTPNRTTSHHS